jgi:hypothetical protein
MMPKHAPAGDTRAGAFDSGIVVLADNDGEGRVPVARSVKTSGAGRAKRAKTGKSSKARERAPRPCAAAATGGAAAAPAPDGLSPVDIIIGMMRGDLPFDDARFKAAVAAAPYVHARRGTAEVEEERAPRHEDALKELE